MLPKTITASSHMDTMRTTFLIPNLHCPSCVSNIESLLRDLKPRPTLVNISLIDHAVVVSHQNTLAPAAITEAFSESGYEVFDTIFDPAAQEYDTRGGDDHGHTSSGLDVAVHRWLPQHLEVDEASKKLHREHCSACKEEEKKSGKTDQLTNVTAKHSTATLKLFKAVLSVEGMTCSACTGSVTDAIKALPWVSTVNVNLIDHSATVTFKAEENQQPANAIAEAVEDVGYGASVEDIMELSTSNNDGIHRYSQQYKATLSITGMTCASCVGGVTDTLKKLSFVHHVDVNLLENAGSVVFYGKNNASELVTSVEDAGYDAEITDIKLLHVEKGVPTHIRTVAIKVDGMHCIHCPGRVLDALSELPVTIEKQPDLTDGIVKINYQPQAPDLTIRTIIARIAAVDTSFSVGVHHPPTVEEKSRNMMAKERRRLFYRVVLSAISAIPTLIIGVIYMNLVSSHDAGYQYLMHELNGVSRAEWATFIMATPVYFFAADIFHRRTLKELYSLWRPGSKVPILKRFYKFGSMNMLISFGTTISYAASLAELIISASGDGRSSSSGPKSLYFDSVVFLTFFLLLGRLAEAHMKAKSGDAVAALGSLRPSKATLIERGDSEHDDKLQSVSLDLLEVGDLVKVFNGTSPPCDGILVQGQTEFDESSLTGESKMVSKKIGDQVFSGTLNKSDPVILRVTEISGNSMLDSIIQVVREGQAKRAPVERIADLLTSYFVPIIVFLAITTWMIWLGLGTSGILPKDYLDSGRSNWPVWSLQFAIAVFVIACPCGLGLAAPTALFVGGGMAAKRGILVKGGGEAFQEASGLDCIVFDKTGTLTEGGEPSVTDYEVVDPATLPETAVFGIAQSLEENSSHPLAKAICSFVGGKSAGSITMLNAKEIPGKGMTGSLSMNSVTAGACEAIIGNHRLMTEHDVTVPGASQQSMSSWQDQGKSVVMVAIRATAKSSDADGGKWQLSGLFAISDPIRSSAEDVVSALRDIDIDVWMLSGDNQSTAEAIAGQVGIPSTNVIAGVLPEEKASKIKYLQSSLSKSSKVSKAGTNRRDGRAVVAMVGDGINDAPALTTADVGIAIGSGSDVALNSASFILINSELQALLTLIKLSRAVFQRIKLNFAWALVYNLIALPVAAGVLYPITTGSGSHVRLDPVWAALAMALSSVSVVGSSLLLRTRIWGVGFRDT